MPQPSPRTGDLSINVHHFTDPPKYLSPSPTTKTHKATNTFDASADNKLGRYLVLGVSVASLCVAILFLIVAFVEHTHDGKGGRKVPLPWLRSWVKSPAVGPTNRRKHVESRTLVLSSHDSRVRPDNNMHHVDMSLSAEAQNQTIVTKTAIDNEKHHNQAHGKDNTEQSNKDKEAIGAEWTAQQTTADKPAAQEKKHVGKGSEKAIDEKKYAHTRNHKHHKHHKHHHQQPSKN